jgi:hypothetical protein
VLVLLAALDKSLCLSAAEKRDYAVFSDLRQLFFATPSLPAAPTLFNYLISLSILAGSEL